MKYIIFYSTKGGVGKSTLVKLTHRVLAKNNGKRVTGDDTDPQQHYKSWLDRSPELTSDADNADYFLYDTEGSHTKYNAELLEAAVNVDAVILIPTNPVPFNEFGEPSDEVVECKRIAERLGKLGIKHKARFVLNKVNPVSKKKTAQFIELLESTEIEVSRKHIPNRAAFGSGPTAREVNDM